MPYSTTPITSGAAKFSTLDPDADLFLEENNITVGANPENPATLYDYSTSTLTIGNIQTTNGELDIHNSDLIGVKRLMCKDYFGSVKATASANLGYTAVLDDTYSSSGNGYVYSNIFFRIPSNIISGSTISVTYTGQRLNGGTINAPVPYVGLYKLNADGTKTVKTSTQFTTATGETKTITDTLTVEGGELYSIYAYTAKSGYYNPGPTGIDGSAGLSIKYDLTAVLNVLWDTITP